MIARIGAKMKVLTPIHIGTGRKLVKDFDYVTRSGRTFRIREEALIDTIYARDPELAEQLSRIPPGQLLKPEDLQEDSPFIRYILPGEPSGQEFREAIKDPRDRPYIPGSSLKGALRTVLAWHGWRNKQMTLGSVRLDRRPKFAARSIESQIFGKDPHHDLLRALHVADSEPARVDQLKIYQVRVWTRKGGAAPISVEAIKPGMEFTIEITLDERLFSDWSKKAAGFPLKHHDWLDELPRLAKLRANERLKNEFSFWKAAGFEKVPYQVLAKINELQKLGEGFPIQLGFGTGWYGTTIGEPLKHDPMWTRVYELYSLGKVPRSNRRTPPEAFPASRRVVVSPDGRPSQPLGWVWIQWKEV